MRKLNVRFENTNSKINYLRVILTHACNLNCQGCHGEGQSEHELNSNEDVIEAIKLCIRAGTKKVKFMGGEPTLRLGIDMIISAIKEAEPDVELSMISNGLGAFDLYKLLFEKGLSRLNISVHGWNEEYFIKNTGSNKKISRKFKENLLMLLEHNMVTKLNYVIKRGINEIDLFDMIDDMGKHMSTVKIDILNYLYGPDNANEKEIQYSMDEIKALLDCKYGIKEQNIIHNNYSLDSTQLILRNDVKVNLKTSQLRKQNFLNTCKECNCRDYCIEGISAIRLRTDLAIQPCLLRDDNLFYITKKGYILEELKEYINTL